MKYQQAIFAQRLANMKIGLTQAESYLGNISRMLTEKEINVEALKNEIEEIQCFIQWLREQ